MITSSVCGRSVGRVMSHLLPRVIETEAKHSSENASGKRRSSLALGADDVLDPEEGAPVESSPHASQLSLCGLLASGASAGAAGSTGRESSAQSMADRRGSGRSAEAIGADAVARAERVSRDARSLGKFRRNIPGTGLNRVAAQLAEVLGKLTLARCLGKLMCRGGEVACCNN